MRLFNVGVSLLYPPGSQSEHSEGFAAEALGSIRSGILDNYAAADLGVGTLAEWISHNGIATKEIEALLRTRVTDPAVIRYRQAVLFDLYGREQLREKLQTLIPKMQEVTVFARSGTEATSAFQQALWKLAELELYVECVDQLYSAFAEEPEAPNSNGIAALIEAVKKEANDDTFQTLREELPKLRSGLKSKKSVTIGVNLDERLRPVEAALLSVNNKAYSEKGLISGIMKAVTGDTGYSVGTRLHQTPKADQMGLRSGERIPLAPLFQDLEQVLQSVARNLLRSLEKYMNVHTGLLRSLHRELAFYLGACRAMDELTANALPICKPDVTNEGTEYFVARELYNVHLARRNESAPGDIVTNDVEIRERKRIFLLTGPNQGGKTTFVQALGLAQVLAQAGLFVPAQSARIRPVDSILTHFPTGEQGSQDTGRFSEELERLSELLSNTTDNSLVLLNESLSSTNPVEASSVAQEILRALRVLGTRCVFATHLHELAYEIDEINDTRDAAADVAHLRAEVAENDGNGPVQRTYRIVEGPPMGTSYARDIAERHGMSFERILDGFKRRGLLE